MVKQYLQQVWQLFRQQPVVAWITVAGTALSIFLIMLVVMGVTTYPVSLPGQPSVAVDVRATDSAMAWRLGAALVPVHYCDLPRSRLLPYHSHQHSLSAPPTDKCSPAS